MEKTTKGQDDIEVGLPLLPSRIKTNTSEPLETPKACPECKKPQSANYKFCEFCGKQLIKTKEELEGKYD